MRIIACGSRSFKDYLRVAQALAEALPLGGAADVTVVEGGAAGADCCAKNAAVNLGCEVETHRADWDRDGKAAGYIRNRLMASLGADLCLAFWDGESRGTLNMIQEAVKVGIPVRIVPKVKT